jgi:hypothetical protein
MEMPVSFYKSEFLSSSCNYSNSCRQICIINSRKINYMFTKSAIVVLSSDGGQ